jgi:hypothetical protein
MTTNLQYRSAGWYAIASGIIGALAFGFLMTYLKIREENFAQGIFFLRFHDGGAVLQFLLLIPVVLVLHKLLQKRTSTIKQTTLKIGIGSLVFTALFLLLTIPKILSDVLYLFPQGVFGVWLIFVNWRMKGILSKGLVWFGIVVGTGLAISGIFPVGYAIFVDTIILQIPAASDEAVQKIATDTTANIVLHQLVGIGLVGVVMLPVWAIVIGRRLLREKI